MRSAIDFETLAKCRELDLELGVALIAKDHYPGLQVRDVIAMLDELAKPLKNNVDNELVIEVAVRRIASHMFETLGFRPNTDSFSDPKNSFINDVVTSRLGIPISLSFVFLAIAKRLGIIGQGVAFPGHFLVRFERADGSPLVVDPYSFGVFMGNSELQTLLKKSMGSNAKLSLAYLRPATPRTTLVRWLQNLKNAYLLRGDRSRALLAASRVVDLLPKEPWARRDRGLLLANMGSVDGALNDLRTYLQMAQNASDLDKINEAIARLEDRASNDKHVTS